MKFRNKKPSRPSQTQGDHHIYETGGVERYDEGNGPLLPTDLVMDILDSLSLKDLLLSARKVCRLWNTMAMYRARKLISSWLEKVPLAVPSDVEIIYYGTRSKIHWGDDLISDRTKIGKLTKCLSWRTGPRWR